MEKLLNSLRKHCLSIFTVSRWMDNPQSQRGGGRRQQEPCAVWSLALPPEGRAFTEPGAGFSTWIPSPPINRMERGLLRKAEPGLQGLRSRRWRWQRQPLQALLAVCALGSLRLAGEARLPREGSSPTPTSLPETSPPWGLSAELAPGS